MSSVDHKLKRNLGSGGAKTSSLFAKPVHDGIRNIALHLPLQALLEYCKQDALSTMKILEKLQEG
jgi:hypothetical protein